jgi:hypothetical protein
MSEEEGEEKEKSVMSDKNFKRQDRLQIGYKVTSIVYLGVSILHIVRKGLNSWALYYACGGPLLASGITYILAQAASNDRISSDTYKRLNLSLLTFGVLGLTLPVLDPIHFRAPVFIIPPLLATVNSIKGYGYGVLGWDKKKEKSAILTDLKESFQSTFQSLITFRKESLDYLLATSMVVIMTVVKCKELFGSSTTNPLMVASKVSRMARLMLFSGVLFTLKDAADRNRLSGTTFVQLNYLSSAVFLSMAGTFDSLFVVAVVTVNFPSQYHIFFFQMCTPQDICVPI